MSNELLAAAKEAREACAACFRVIARSSDEHIMDALEAELKLAGVRDGFGVRLQNAIAEHAEEHKEDA